MKIQEILEFLFGGPYNLNKSGIRSIEGMSVMSRAYTLDAVGTRKSFLIASEPLDMATYSAENLTIVERL